MLEEAVKEFLHQAKADWSMIERLIRQGQLIELNYQGKRFYMRRHSTR
jgi:hypothetical protein